MAKIHFENGVTVNFEGVPTPQDIEEVANTIGINKPKGISGFDVAKQYPSAFMGAVKDVGVGALKGVGSTLAGASELGEKYLLRPIDKAMGIKSPEQTGVESLGIRQAVQPVGTTQKIGFGAEQIGEFFIPGGAAGKIGKATETATKGGKLLKGAVRLGATAGTEASIFGGQTALQTGEVGSEAKTAGLMGAAFPIAGRVLKPTAKLLGEGVTQLLGKSTGAGEYALKEAMNNPSVIKFAREAGAEGAEGLQRKAAEEAKSALNLMSQNRSKAYVAQLEKIKLNKTQQDALVDELRTTAKNLASPEKFDIKIIADETGKKINVLDFAKSVITDGQQTVQRAYEDIFTWTKNTPAGLDILKKRLGNYVSQTKYGTPARNILTNLRNTLDTSLKKGIKGYEKMTSGFRQSSELIEEIEKALSLGDKTQTDTAIRKLMSTMRQSNEFRKELLQTLSKTGGKDIMGKIAGSTLASVAPRGLAGTLFPFAGAGGVAFSILNPSTWPLAVTYLAASSPRLVGEFMNLVGKAKRLGTGALEDSPLLRTQINRIFGDAEKEFGKSKPISTKLKESKKSRTLEIKPKEERRLP